MRRLACTLLVVSTAFLTGGCGEGPEIEIRYTRPPRYVIPKSIKRIAVAEFGGKTRKDQQWGIIASDRLASTLHEYNRKFQRYQLVDRQRLKAILDERDLQMAITESSQAVQAGKIAGVEAMIYGNVKVSSEDQNVRKTVFDPLRQRPKTVYQKRRYCHVEVNFTMDAIATGKTLASVSTSREYDSQEDDNAIASAMGFGGGEVPPTDQVISHLIDKSVEEFVSKISPHEQVVTEKLQKGKAKVVETGNKLAEAGEYEEALECYERAIRANPEDHGAIFNAGLMYESQGELDKAYKYYDRAFSIEPEEKYIYARKRIKDESAQAEDSNG